MAEPNGLARSSRYSGVAGGCSLETKARDKAVVTDGIKEMEELVYISRMLCRGRGWHRSGLPERCCRELPRNLHAPARPSLARSLARSARPRLKNGTRRNTQLGRGSFGDESRGEEGADEEEEGMTACCAETTSTVGFRFLKVRVRRWWKNRRGYDTFDIDGQDVTMTIDEDRDNGTRYEETRRDTISDTTRYEAMR